MVDILEFLLACERCKHGVSLHDGDGCAHASCDCRDTKENCLEMQIALEIMEHRASFPSIVS